MKDDRWPASLLWYTSPAAEWKDGLPLGNGKLAAMVLGGVERDRIALNHEWLWRGQWRQKPMEERHHHLKQIRELFFGGKMFEAATLANETLGGLGGVSGVRNRVDSYQPAGDLLFETGHKAFADYRRQLDLDRSVVAVSYRCGKSQFERQYFAHSTLPVIAMRLTSSVKSKLTLRLSRTEDPDCRIVPYSDGATFGFTGRFREGIRFVVEARVAALSGQVNNSKPGSIVVQADDIVLLLSIAVGLDGSDPLPQCRKNLAKATGSWTQLREAHVRTHRRLYRRVRLEIGDEKSDVPTDVRLTAFRKGKPDDSLPVLFANFGRYLLISASRSGGLVMNLQGKWNEDLNPPWECDLHHDINIQMHHWPAEVCGLSECHEPLFDHIERFVPSAREAARKLYDCRGVCFPLQTDPWGQASPESHGWDVWTGAAAWLAQHLWWRYEYSRDKNFLGRRAYPFIREVAAFYEDYLVRHPAKRWLVPVPSQSPENHFVGGTKPVSLCVAATMDIELIHDLMTHAIAAAEILGVDAAQRKRWRRVLSQLPPLQVGRHGQLQEWLEDYDEAEPGHRHISHLFALFPGEQITPEHTPQLADAARVALERRLAHEGGHCGWGWAWVACCYARLRDGEAAYEALRHVLSDFATTSLLGLYPPTIFQIDGNLGATAALCEMLLQSHRGVIRILPALPNAWPRGRVSGLRARGGFMVDIEWNEGRATRVRIYSILGGVCHVAFGGASPVKLGNRKGQTRELTP